MASRTLYIVIGIVVILVIAGVALYLSQGGQQAQGGQQGKRTIKIGALAPLTGQLASYGEGMKNAVQLAVEDANSMCPNVQFQLTVLDTGTNEQKALENLQNLQAQGIRLVPGPMSSKELSNIMSFAQQYKIILNSPSSTSPGLAVPGRKYVLRVVPIDTEQAKALAALLAQLGIKKIVILYRGDTYGEGLAKALTDEAKARGITVVDSQGYDTSEAAVPTSVPAAVSRLSKYLGSPSDDAALVMVTFETDGLVAVQRAAEDPVLGKIRWIGADGVAYSRALLNQTGSVLAAHKFIATIAGPDPNDPKYQEFKARFRAKYRKDPVAYDPYSYDAAMILLQAACRLGTDDPDRVWDLVMQWGKNGTYYGVTGRVFLNDVGDRAKANYIVGGVKLVNGTAKWVDAAYYYGDTGQIRQFDESFFK